jgi:hypothetical protein
MDVLPASVQRTIPAVKPDHTWGRFARLGAAGASLLVSFACAPQRPTRNHVIPVSCIRKPVELIDCDQASPPNCQKEKVFG